MSGTCIHIVDPGSRWIDPEPPTLCGETCEGDLCEDHEENPC